MFAYSHIHNHSDREKYGFPIKAVVTSNYCADGLLIATASYQPPKSSSRRADPLL